jgi:histone-lysine N-methyltransferase SETD2
MEDDEYATNKMGGIKIEDGAVNGAHPELDDAPALPTPDLKDASMDSPGQSQDDFKSRSESVGTPSSQKPPSRLPRKTSQKNQQPPRTPTLYHDLPDVTEQSCSTFQVIPDCLYGSKHLGSTDNDALDCECREEWRKLTIFSLLPPTLPLPLRRTHTMPAVFGTSQDATS